MTILASRELAAGRTADEVRPVAPYAALVATVLALMAVGLMMVFSASRTVEAERDGYYFGRHMVFLPVALVVLAAATRFPYAKLNRRWVGLAALAVTVGLLVAVLFFGQERNYARRWFALPLGSFSVSLQPSEIAKLGLALFLAWYFSRPAVEARRFVAGFVVPMATVGAVAALIAVEDLGTGALVGTIGALVCLIAGTRLRYFLLALPPAALGFYVFVARVPYRWERLVVFVDPWAHESGSGWHVIQSLMAIGRGGLFGVGIGAGVQKFYLPENATDFIFSVLCEEMGILGGILVLGLFGVLVWRAGQVVRHAPDRFALLLASGLTLAIGLQAAINIGVVTAALPAKGIGLPFVSYGGSGLVIMSAAAGLLASIARRTARPRPEAVPLVHRHATSEDGG